MDTGSEKVQLNIVDVDGENGNQNASAPGFFEDPFDSDFWRAVSVLLLHLRNME